VNGGVPKAMRGLEDAGVNSINIGKLKKPPKMFEGVDRNDGPVLRAKGGHSSGSQPHVREKEGFLGTMIEIRSRRGEKSSEEKDLKVTKRRTDLKAKLSVM